jgi:ribosomal subunit interface protein
MQIKVTGKNLDVGSALREHVEDRLRQLQQRYFEGTVHAHVTVEKQRGGFHTDCTLHLATGLLLQAHGSAPEAHPSFDQAASHLEKQLRRYKNRLKDHHKSRREPVRQLEAVSYVISPAPEEEAEAAGLNPCGCGRNGYQPAGTFCRRGRHAARHFQHSVPALPERRPRRPQSCVSPPRWQHRLGRSQAAGLT